MTYYIYLIKDKNTNNVYYVGRTINFEQRKRSHNSTLASKFKSRKMPIPANLNSVYEIIDIVEGEKAVVEEIKWIKHYAKFGHLVNTSHVKDFKYGNIKIKHKNIK